MRTPWISGWWRFVVAVAAASMVWLVLDGGHVAHAQGTPGSGAPAPSSSAAPGSPAPGSAATELSAPAPTPSGSAAPSSTAPPPRLPLQGADPRLWEEHGLMNYTAVRTSTPPKIDGILDDAIWATAPVDNRFKDAFSKPYGAPVTEPTSIQVAYDNDYLYVAFRCAYSKPGDRDDSFAPDEKSLVTGSEWVGVLIDPRHDHTNGRPFVVSRAGARADIDYSQNGQIANYDWRGIWDAATKIQGDTWTAELAIPWSTVGLPSHDGDFTVGINFRRDIPRAGLRGTWSLTAPAPGAPANPPSFAGHLLGLSDVHPGKRLYLQPFVVGRYRSDTSIPFAGLRDFTGTNGNASISGGLYARFRPIGALQIDLAANPDFSQVPPDQALANLDRFELVLPETRPFFTEDRGKFEFGTDNAQLFYTRRVGLQAAPSSRADYVEVPILYAAKAVVRESGTEAAVMNVGLTNPTPKVSLADGITVGRVNHAFGKSTRIGSILLLRKNGPIEYSAAGVDGAVTFMNENLVVSGFFAESSTTGNTATTVGPASAATGRDATGNVGRANIEWDSADFEAGLSYLDVSRAFDPQLGYFQLTGARTVTATGGYTPIVKNDFVYEIDLRSSVVRAMTQDDVLVYNRQSLSFGATLINRSQVSMAVLPATEGVLKPFTIAGGRVNIPVGRYDVKNVQFLFSSPPRRMLEVAVGYTEGELFFGYQRTPQIQLGLNIRRFSGTALYKVFLLHMNADQLVGHQLSSRLSYAYSPTARTALAIEANTLDPRATVQLLNSITFGELSTLALTMQQSAAGPPDVWTTQGNFTAILSFGYGLSLL